MLNILSLTPSITEFIQGSSDFFPTFIEINIRNTTEQSTTRGHEPQLTHLEIATAGMQMLCNIFLIVTSLLM